MSWIRSLAVVVVVTLVLAELGIRLVRPVPPVQLLRDGVEGLHIEEVGGIPMWTVDAPPTFEMPARCAEGGAIDVAFVGDSVFAAVVDAGDWSRTFGQRIADRIHSARQDVCVWPVSVSGFGPAQQRLALQRVHQAVGLDAAVIGVYKSTATWVRAGRWWINTRTLGKTDAGMPLAPVPVPDGVHRTLFDVSALWRTATLVVASRDDSVSTNLKRDMSGYEAIRADAAEEGIEVLWTYWPNLDVPFSESLPSATPDRSWSLLLYRAGLARGDRSLWIAELLQDLDVEAIRGDLCCHYVQGGHDLLADRLQPHVEALLSSVDQDVAPDGARGAP